MECFNCGGIWSVEFLDYRYVLEVKRVFTGRASVQNDANFVVVRGDYFGFHEAECGFQHAVDA